MKILITGGLGYIGAHLVRFLSNGLGHRVRILTRRVPGIFKEWQKKFEIIQADVTDKKKVVRSAQGCDAVIHLASLDKIETQANPQRALIVSCIGTRNMLEESVESHVKRFLYFSSFHVYGTPKVEKVTENTTVMPLNDYSLNRYVGELFCRQFEELYDLKPIILRPSNGYGAPLHRKVDCWFLVLNDFCRSAFQSRKIVIKSEGTQQRDFVSIPKILEAVRLLLETDISETRYPVYNIGSGSSYSIKQLAFLVRDAYFQRYHEEVKIEFTSDVVPADFSTPFKLDISRIREMGFRPEGPDAIHKEIEKIFDLLEK
jgi:UDP-glucose 4-epimerase